MGNHYGIIGEGIQKMDLPNGYSYEELDEALKWQEAWVMDHPDKKWKVVYLNFNRQYYLIFASSNPTEVKIPRQTIDTIISMERNGGDATYILDQLESYGIPPGGLEW